MSLVVRKAVRGDAGGLFGQWQAARRHYAATDHRIVLAAVTPGEFEAALALTVERATSLFLVAEDGGVLAGFASAGVEGNQPDRLPERHVTLGYLFVDEGHRRRGVAKRLVAEVEDWARSLPGVTHVEMSVLAADAPAGEFWGRMGFTPFISRLWKPLLGGGAG